jgi:hypothetical protein
MRARQARRLGKPKRGLGWVDPTGANMTVAFNTGADTYYAGRRFCNIVLDMSTWSPVTVTGADRTGPTFVPYANYTGSANTWTQYQGSLYGDGDGSGTDAKYFRAPIASTAYGLPDGTYTVLNPSGLEFAVGVFGNPTSMLTWSSAKYQTLTFTSAGGAGMMLWFRGKNFINTGAGNLQIVRSGGASGSLLGDGTVDHTTGLFSGGTTGYTGGNPWVPDFLAFHQGLGTQNLRWMPALMANVGVEQDFADRIQVGSMAYVSHYLNGHAVPHELVIDFANRTGIDPWINIPPQANSDYILKCAALYAALLDANRKCCSEYSNETFNYFSAFATGTWWMQYGQFTKRYAMVSDASAPGAPIFYQPAHGRSVGDVVVLFPTRENAHLNNNATFYMSSGYSYTISAVTDADHFTLNLAAFGRTLPSGLVNILYAWTSEPGCTATVAQANINHGVQQAAVWDAFDAALGRARVVHSMGSQAADSSRTSGRLGASSAIALRTDHVHVAPYYNGLYWIASLTGVGSTITPRLWSSVAGTAWWGVYVSGSTPTSLDIIKQQGTGFIGGGGTAGTACSSNPAASSGLSPALPAVSGLTDGTNYAAFIVFQETATGLFWRIGTGTDAANPANVLSTAGSPVYLYDTRANQSVRGRLNTLSVANYDAHAAAIAAASSPASLICYEGGPDMNLWSSNGATMVTTQLQQWLLNYLTDTTAVATLKNYYNHLARVGYRSLTHFLDIQGGGQYAPVGGAGIYDFVNNQLFGNITDPRYVMLSAYGGLIPKQSAIPSGVSAARVATAITAAPGSFPATVYSGLTGGYTYTIVNGDWTGNFGISGTNVVMLNANGIDFSKYGPRVLTIEAADAYSSTTVQLTIPLGSAWWEADAQFVWDSVGASAGTSMLTPTNLPFSAFGGALAEITGSGNPVITSSSGTVSNDLWKMSSYVFANAAAGTTQSVPTNVPFLVAHLVDVGDQTSTFVFVMGIGAGANSISFGVGGAITNSHWRLVVNNVAIFPSGVNDIATNPAKGTKAVHWLYVDPVAGTAVGGVNQTAYSAGALSGLTIGSFAFSRDVRMGNANGGASTVSQMYQGSLEVVSRAGLTQTQALAIVQRMQTHHGI